MRWTFGRTSTDWPRWSSTDWGSTSHRHYLAAGGLSIGVLVSTGALPALAPSAWAPPALTSITLVKVEYWHQDHLGSLAATTDHAGAVTARFAYDPFGARRSAGGGYDVNGTLVIDYSAATNNGADRGFTGHEHLDDIGLIHMNGRLYDARLGLFLQADPVIQEPLNLQDYNRYVYCLSGPLACTDPSGYSWLSKTWKKIWRSTVGRVAIAIAVSVVTYGYGSEWAVQWLASTETAATVGYSAAAIKTTAAVGGGIAAGFSSGLVLSGGDLKVALQGAVVGAITAGTSEYFSGAGPLTRLTANAIAGGATARLGGGSFEQGVKLSILTFLASEGWKSVAEYTDNLKMLACATPESQLPCKYNQFGELLTDGGRDIDYTRNADPTEGNFLTRGGMAPEGSGLHEYSEWSSTGRFVNRVSKVHDFFNSWNYSDAGWYMSRGVLFDSLFQIYSFSGMLPAAALTMLSFLPQYGLQPLSIRAALEEDRGNRR